MGITKKLLKWRTVVPFKSFSDNDAHSIQCHVPSKLLATVFCRTRSCWCVIASSATWRRLLWPQWWTYGWVDLFVAVFGLAETHGFLCSHQSIDHRWNGTVFCLAKCPFQMLTRPGKLTVCELERSSIFHGQINYFDWASYSKAFCICWPGRVFICWKLISKIHTFPVGTLW